MQTMEVALSMVEDGHHQDEEVYLDAGATTATAAAPQDRRRAVSTTRERGRATSPPTSGGKVSPAAPAAPGGQRKQYNSDLGRVTRRPVTPPRAKTRALSPRRSAPGIRQQQMMGTPKSPNPATRKTAFDSLFRQYDTNGDGVLDADEVARMIAAVRRIPGANQHYVRKPDAPLPPFSKSMRVCYLKCYLLCHYSDAFNCPNRYQVAGLMGSFARFDTDGNGTIDRSEFEMLWDHLALLNQP